MRVCGLIAYCPPVWPIVATALVASIGDARQFKSGRELAAWTGLVPRQVLDGRQGAPGRRGTTCQSLLAATARARRASCRVALEDEERFRSRCFQAVIERRGFDKGIVAMANKTARMAWAMLVRQENYARVDAGSGIVAQRRCVRGEE